jgi:hypothetical protein
MNIQLIHIEQLQNNGFSDMSRAQKTSEFQYIGIAIKEQGSYYYWARGISLRITEQEYHHIRANPKLYYFSTALKLHLKIDRYLHSENFDGL